MVLSSTYDYLDSKDPKKDKKALQSKHSSYSDWPNLEGALFEWQERILHKKAIITRDVLKLQATKLWNNLLQY